MKKLVLITCLSISVVATAQQKEQIDQRLLTNKDIAAKAQDNFSNNPQEYNLMVFALDNGWFTQSYESLNSSQKSQLLSIDGIVSSDGKPFDPAVLSDPSKFNFYNYNFQRHETRTTAYNLGNGQVLVFYSAEKLRLMFEQNTSNQ